MTDPMTQLRESLSLMRPIDPPTARSCGSCPWLPQNIGAGGKVGVPANHCASRADLWPKIADGTLMSCHLGDPRCRDDETIGSPRECRGAVAVVMDELDRLERDFAGDVDAYVAATPFGLTPNGVEFWRERLTTLPDRYSDVDREQPARHGLDVCTPTGPTGRPMHENREWTDDERDAEREGLAATYRPAPVPHPSYWTSPRVLPDGRPAIDPPEDALEDRDQAPCVRAAVATLLGIGYMETPEITGDDATQATVAAAMVGLAAAHGFVVALHFDAARKPPAGRDYWLGFAIEPGAPGHTFVMHTDVFGDWLVHDPEPVPTAPHLRWCGLTLDREHIDGVLMRDLLDEASGSSGSQFLTLAVTEWRKAHGEPTGVLPQLNGLRLMTRVSGP